MRNLLIEDLKCTISSLIGRYFVLLKSVFVFTFILAGTFQASAQDLVWAKSIGASETELGSTLMVDEAGCVYLAGSFDGISDFDPSSVFLPHTSNGGYDIFIQKLDSNGNLIWVQTIGGSSNDEAFALCSDSTGNIYATGHFEGLVDFNPDAGVSYLSGAGNADVFILKLDSAGNFQWARRIGGPSNDYARAICCDSLNQIYITGTAAPSADFDPGVGSLVLTNDGGYDAYVLKLSDAGSLVWAKNFGGPGSEWGLSLEAGHSGSLYISGFFYQTADFDPGPGIASALSNGGSDVFLLKMDTAGTFNWIKTFGGASNDEGISMTLPDASHICLVGHYAGWLVDLDPGSGIQNFSSVGGGTDIYVGKFDNAGDLVWMKAYGGDNLDEPAAVTHDEDGNIYTTGLFRNSVDFNPGTSAYVLTTTFPTGPGVFLQKLSPSGIFQWTIAVDCTTIGYDLVLDNSGGIYVVGTIGSDNLDFDPWSEIYELSAPGFNTNAFVMKLGPCIAPDTPVVASSGFVLCAGDSTELFVSSGNLNSAVEWQWFDNFCGGNLIASGPSALVSPSATTTYFVWGSANCSSAGVCGEITINAVPAPLIVSSIVQDEMTGLDGSISLTVSGGTSPYTYQWNGPGSFSSSSEDLLALAAGDYEVTITDANGCDTTLNFIITSFVGIENYPDFFTITPNPTADFFKVLNNSSEGNWSVQLLDLSGRIIYEAEVMEPECTLNLSPFDSGTYVLIISAGDLILIKKIVKAE
jgi:hypothetical protein